MTLRDNFERTGQLLFQRRTLLPLVLAPLVFVPLMTFRYPFDSRMLDVFWELFCWSVSLFGIAIRVFTVGHTPRGTSGRNTNKQKAEMLNVTGVYSVVRHPLYLGNYFVCLGVFLFNREGWVPVMATLAFALYYERIMLAEEAYLSEKFQEKFLAWAENTPAFFPRFARWQRPALPFSVKTALKREYVTFYGLVAVFTMMETITQYVITGSFLPDRLWMTIFTAATFAFVLVRFLAKRTALLEVSGR